jgi:hypothetical protein
MPERDRPNREGPGSPRPPGFKPPREFQRQPHPPDALPPYVREYITGLAHLRTASLQVAEERLRAAERAREWPARGLVDAPLAIALRRLGRNAEAEIALERADRTIERWIDELIERPLEDSPTGNSQHVSEKFTRGSFNRNRIPWQDFAEALVLHREATLEIKGRLPDLELQLDAVRAAAFAKLNASE